MFNSSETGYYLCISTRLLWIYLSWTPYPNRWSMTGLHTVRRRVNCGGIICHLFITQAISLALFIFLQDPGHVLIILNADWQCCVTTTLDWKAESQPIFVQCRECKNLNRLKNCPCPKIAGILIKSRCLHVFFFVVFVMGLKNANKMGSPASDAC